MRKNLKLNFQVSKLRIICISGLEFESERAFLIRIWDNQDFTYLFKFTKYTFKEMEFPPIQKKNKGHPYESRLGILIHSRLRAETGFWLTFWAKINENLS